MMGSELYQALVSMLLFLQVVRSIVHLYELLSTLQVWGFLHLIRETVQVQL